MANPTDPKVAQELADAMKSVGEYAEEATDAFEQQLKVVSQMRDAMEEVAKVMYALCQQDCKALNPDVWKAVTKEVLKKEKAVKNSTKEVKKLAQTLEKDFYKGVTVAVGALTGLVQGFKNLAALGRSFGGVVSSIIGGVWELGKSILSIPLKIMEGLFSMAAKGGSNELDTALQGLVKRYGDLGGVGSQAVIHAAKSMAQATNDGFNAYRVFGNLAERIKAVQEMTEGMGATFNVFSDEVDKNGFALARFQKGLGFTSEQMEGLAHAALRTDKDMADVATDMTKMSQELSKAFKVPAKTISSDMAKAMKDLAHFGSLSTKELGVAATFANKLGVSVDKLTSIMDATKTYDQTAESMSKLNETYNTNIDYTKMMMLAEKGPQAQLQYLRDEFKKAGKDLSNLTYYDKLFIKSTGAMTDELINTAFATKNASVSLDKMGDAADKAEKSTMNQKDALKALVKETEKRPMEGMVGSGGIFDRFLQGISLGIERSPEFMKLMMNIRQIFRDAYWAGVKFGRMIVDTFPGVKDIISGLADLFTPGRFKKFFDDIEKIFRDFSAKGGKDVEGLLKNLQDNFLSFFDKETPAGRKVIEGFEKFWTVIGGILGKLAEMAVEKLAEFVQTVTSWIGNPQIPTQSTGLTNALMAPFMGAFNALVDKLLPALEALATKLWEKLTDFLMNKPLGQKMLFGAFMVVIGPAILGALTSAIAAGMLKGAGSLIFGSIAKQMVDEKSSAADIAKKMIGDAKKPEGGGVSKAADAAATAIPSKESIDKLSVAEQKDLNWSKIKNFLIGLAGVMFILVGTFAAVAAIASQLDPVTVMKAVPIFMAITTSLLPIGILMKTMSEIKSFDSEKVNEAMKSVGKLLLIGVVAFIGASFIVAGLNPDIGAILKTSVIAIAMAATFAPMGLLVIEAAAVGKILNALGNTAMQGFMAMVGIMYGMAAAVGGLAFLVTAIGGAGGIEAMSKVADIMNTISNVFMKVGVVIGEAAIIGAAILYSAGVGAVLITTGFAAMTGAVTVMAATAISIIKDISSMPGDTANLKDRVSIFTDVLNSITAMMNVVPGILKSIDFGFWDTATEKTRRMDSVNNIIKSLLNGERGDGGIQGIVKTLIDGMTSGMKDISPDKIKSFSVIGDIFKSVTGLIAGIGSAIKSAEVPSKIDVKGEATTVVNNIVSQAPDLSKILTDLSGSLPQLMNSLKDTISKIPTDKDFLNKAEQFGKLIDSIGKIVSTVSTSMTGLRKKGYKESDYSPAKVIGENLSFIDGVFKLLVDGVLPAGSAAAPNGLVSSSIGEIMQSMNKLSINKENLDKASSIASFLESIGKIIQSIKNASGGNPIENADQEISRISKSMYVADYLLQHLYMGTDKNGDIIKGATPGEGSISNIVKSLKDINTSVKGAESLNAAKAVSDNVTNLLSSVSGMVTKIISIPSSSAQEVSSKMLEVKATIDAIPEKLKDIGTSLTSQAANPVVIQETALRNTLAAVKTLSQLTADINKEINKMGTIVVPAALNEVAGGLGKKAEYKIQAGEKIVMNIELHVTMDAGKVEKAIVNRQTSILRDRINYIMEQIPIKQASTEESAFLNISGAYADRVAKEH